MPHSPESDSTVVSDKSVITGLSLENAKLVGITGCVDTATDRVTGLTTIWGEWDGSKYDNVQRLNVIGRLSGISEYDNSDALAQAGLSDLSTDQDLALQRFWFYEASPENKQLYDDSRGDLGSESWLNSI